MRALGYCETHVWLEAQQRAALEDFARRYRVWLRSVLFAVVNVGLRMVRPSDIVAAQAFLTQSLHVSPLVEPVVYGKRGHNLGVLNRQRRAQQAAASKGASNAPAA